MPKQQITDQNIIQSTLLNLQKDMQSKKSVKFMSMKKKCRECKKRK